MRSLVCVFQKEGSNMQAIYGMKIVAKKEEVLKALRENRSLHAQIVVEARAGYMEQARAALEAKMKLLETGKLVSLDFSLSPPVDHTDVYDTAIKMLELDTRETVDMDQRMVSSLIMDQWEWQHEFIGTNALYSQTAMTRHSK
jgi:hypothetical protein